MIVAILGFIATAFVLIVMTSGFLLYAWVSVLMCLAASTGVVTWLVLRGVIQWMFPHGTNHSALLFLLEIGFTAVSVLIAISVGYTALRWTYYKVVNS